MSISIRLPRESPRADEHALAAAVNYARLQRSKSSREAAVQSLSMPARGCQEDPDEAQRALMATLGITFQDGIYRLGARAFERLADAVDDARRQLQSPDPD